MIVMMVMMIEEVFEEDDFYSEFPLLFAVFFFYRYIRYFTNTDASLDVVTSRKVRDKIKLGHSIEQLVGEKINEYVNIHHIGAKVL